MRVLSYRENHVRVLVRANSSGEHTVTSQTWASEGFFLGGGQWWIFPEVVAKNFSQGGGKSDVISIFPLETQNTTFSAENITGTCQIFKI